MSKIPAAFTPTAKQRVYGRRSGRTLTSSRKVVMETLLPALSISESVVKGDATLDPHSLFETTAPIVFEIGFGNGEHLKAMMEQYPHRNYIGAEPFINGMSAFLKSIADLQTLPLRVWMDDAVVLSQSFTSESIDAIYILNPDPWPKKRHYKRRIVRPETLQHFHRVLKTGGDLIMATDVDDLADWMVTQTMQHGGFEWQAKSPQDWKQMPENWVLKTRYATKGEAAGRKQTYLLFKKTSAFFER